MLINETKVIKIFIEVDDFCKAFDEWSEKTSLSDCIKKVSRRGVKPKMCRSEIMTIMILYHLSGYKCFEYFYKQELTENLQSLFPHALTYERFVARIPEVSLLMYLFGQFKASQGDKTGVYFIDSKALKVCHIKREKQHCVFRKVAAKGKSSMGWFYGLKLHLVINNIGQILHFAFTPGNIADNNALVLKHLFDNLKGKCIGDKGYLTKLFETFLEGGLQIITKIKCNMKNVLISLIDKLLLRKRGVIESVFDILTSITDLEHSRHRSPENAFTSMFAAISAYAFLERKPSIDLKKLSPNS